MNPFRRTDISNLPIRAYRDEKYSRSNLLIYKAMTKLAFLH